MDKHLLTEIEIKNFKCFKDFKAEGFKRVNLIGGKNNVGKTAFMEACYINVSSKNIESMTNVISDISLQRNVLEYIGGYDVVKERKKAFEHMMSFSFDSNIRKINFKILNENGKKEYLFSIDKKDVKINVNDFSFETKPLENIQLIGNIGLANLQIKSAFESVQKKDKENILYKYVNEFDKNILNFKIIGGDKPQCKTLDGEYRDINDFGDGLKHYISIICSLYDCSSGYLFIDEIDNGIHYTQLDRLWEIIFHISKEQNVQVFSITHSKECIESYARVSKKLQDDEISLIELGRNKNNELDSIIMDSERLLRYLKEGNEVRGW